MLYFYRQVLVVGVRPDEVYGGIMPKGHRVIFLTFSLFVSLLPCLGSPRR